ncbi:MAG: tRNA (adenosine(37)-N6)-threonylcarbamoyltransferase complex transferase subunit TsaD [Chitinophagaceae bacterium]|nr:MAG: tRNA (adenosine(37)-N6)-threonylcarbamoyltransferase complex transferase subunit TsaD [Chitinophagaceae bacterium]
MGPTILAIETSCDETAASVIRGGNILANIIATQAVHEKYGGVVPELASRAHQQHLLPVVSEALSVAKVTKSELDAVAFTQGPGLLGALLVGSSFAKSLSLALQIPLIAVDHMQAHILAHFIEEPRPQFPFLCLTVSGGHTQIVQVNSPLEMVILGTTTDDAVGEAFDKAAKIIGLPYPGGPLLDKLAAKGNTDRFTFSSTNMPGYNFSFSGIKTSFLNFIRNNQQKDPDFVKGNLHDICASLQRHLVNMLMQKLELAAHETGIHDIAIAGGVSANSELRKVLQQQVQRLCWNVFIPSFQYCTDNAGMVAMAAHFMYNHKKFAGQDISPDPRLKFA